MTAEGTNPSADGTHATTRHREFHRTRVIELVERHRRHRANDERMEAAACLAQAELHARFALQCQDVLAPGWLYR